MKVRPATDSDRAALFDLHRAAFHALIEETWGWDEGWQRSNFAAEFARTTTSVLEADGQIVGYLQVWTRRIGSMSRTSRLQQRFKARASAPTC